MPSVLDRAGLEEDPSQYEVENSLQPTKSTVLRGMADTDSVTSTNRLSRYKSKTKRWSAKTKAVFHIRASPEPLEEAPAPTLAPLPKEPVEHTRLDKQMPPSTGEKFVAFVHHPIDTVTGAIQSQGGMAISENVVSKEISHAQDVELVNAHEILIDAEEKGDEAAMEKAEETLESLKKSRQDMFMRWALDRHVIKLRRLVPPATPNRGRHDFVVRDGYGVEKMDWQGYGHHLLLKNADKYGFQYIGAYSEPPDPDQESLTAAIERLIIASAPFQEVVIRARRIYRWENRSQTSMCLAGFLTLWAYDLLISAALLTIVVYVWQRRTHKPNIAELKEELIRVEDENATALNLMEHIEKHGTDDWTSSLIAELGPRIMIEFNDLADTMEIFLSFYEWRDKQRTTYSLSIIAALCLLMAIIPTYIIVKSASLFFAFIFFALWPISSLHPDYRNLVSPMKWLFWEIPTHPEWAISRLQFEGSSQKNDLGRRNLQSPSHDSATGSLPNLDANVNKDRDLLSFPAACKSHQGKIIVGTESVRFETLVRSKEYWRIPYDRLVRVEKLNSSVKLRSGEDLLFTDDEGNEHRADDLKKRNEVFAQVVGYSGVKWQIVG